MCLGDNVDARFGLDLELGLFYKIDHVKKQCQHPLSRVSTFNQWPVPEVPIVSHGLVASNLSSHNIVIAYR